MTDEERNGALDALEGTPVVVKGDLLGDELTLDLTRRGAQIVLDKLRARDFLVTQQKGTA